MKRQLKEFFYIKCAPKGDTKHYYEYYTFTVCETSANREHSERHRQKWFNKLFAFYSSLQQHKLFCKTLWGCRKHNQTHSCKLYLSHTRKPPPLQLLTNRLMAIQFGVMQTFVGSVIVLVDVTWVLAIRCRCEHNWTGMIWSTYQEWNNVDSRVKKNVRRSCCLEAGQVTASESDDLLHGESFHYRMQLHFIADRYQHRMRSCLKSTSKQITLTNTSLRASGWALDG